MLFGAKSLSSALVAMVTLSIAVSAGKIPVEQHLLGRDKPSSHPAQEATGKLANPIDLGKTPASAQTIFKLTGEDMNAITPVTEIPFGQSNIVVEGGGSPAGRGARAHCSLGHASANIRRVRYTMTVQVDRDESGATNVAESDSTRGVVVKATSGLYASSNPDQGASAKTLARHGEVCADRPYVVPRSVVARAKTGAAASDAVLGKTDRRFDEPQPHVHREGIETQPFNMKRSAPVPGSNINISRSGSIAMHSGPNGAVCVDTIKRDAKVIRVLPTVANHDTASGSPLHFQLVRSSQAQNVWHQTIHNAHNQLVDSTQLSLSSNMAFWRAEYLCATCTPGHQKHVVLYENVEVELDEVDEHIRPELQCTGPATSTSVQSQNGGEYKGVVWSIDRVALGLFDGSGKGGMTTYTEGTVQPVVGVIPTEPGIQLPDPAESKKTQPASVKKRDAEVEEEDSVY